VLGRFIWRDIRRLRSSPTTDLSLSSPAETINAATHYIPNAAHSLPNVPSTSSLVHGGAILLLAGATAYLPVLLYSEDVG
jgi:hypothetical protein